MLFLKIARKWDNEYLKLTKKENTGNPHPTSPLMKGEGLKLGSISHTHTVFRLTQNLLSLSREGED
jgi:hypothetical protein